MFNCKKFGMTLGELLMVFGIIALVSVVGFMTTKPYKKASRQLYSKAYDTLLTASYNTLADEKEEYNLTDNEHLCLGLTRYINSVHIDGATRSAYTGFCNTIEDANRVTDQTTSFKNLTPDFTAINGMAFYISAPIETEEIEDSNESKGKVRYYLVYIDLDGVEKGRGSSVQSTHDDPDVVAFILTQDADVLPLGLPLVDKNYLTARVVYPDGEAEDDMKSAGVSYYEAVHKAWGDDTTLEDYRTINFNQYLNNASPLKLPATAFPTKPNRDAQCVDVEFDCDVEITRYY